MNKKIIFGVLGGIAAIGLIATAAVIIKKNKDKAKEVKEETKEQEVSSDDENEDDEPEKVEGTVDDELAAALDDGFDTPLGKAVMFLVEHSDIVEGVVTVLGCVWSVACMLIDLKQIKHQKEVEAKLDILLRDKVEKLEEGGAMTC